MKRRLLTLFIAILALVLCFTACGKTPEDLIPTVNSIEVVEGSVPTQVKIGQTPDFSGIKVIATYSDGSTQEVGFANVTLSQLDTTTAGSKFVTVTYQGISTKFEVTVVDPEATATVTAIKIVPKSISEKYYIGQAPDYSGLQVEATYSTGSVRALPAADYTYTPIDTTTMGKKTFTVTYTANPTLTDSIEVEVINIKSMTVVTGTVKNKIFVGEVLNTSAIEVVVKYDDGTEEIVNIADLVVGTVDTTTYGKKTLAVTYKGVTIQYPVEVVGAVSLKVNQGSCPNKVMYGATLDTSNIAALLTYSDNTEKALTKADLTLGTIDTTSVGTQALTVSYGGLSTTVDVTVVGVQSFTVVNGTLATEILKGNAIDTSAAQIIVTYTDATTAPVDADEITFGDFEVNAPGEQALAIIYLNKKQDHIIKVCEVFDIRVEDVETRNVPAGTPIDLTNMKVYGVYNDSAETEVLLTTGISTNVESLDINSEEDKTLVVSYVGEYGTFSKNVVISTTAPLLSGIRITAYKTYVGLGGTYDPALVVYADYANDTSEKLTTGYSVSAVNTATAGNVTLTVTYTEGGIEKADSVTVKVLPITNLAVSGIADIINKNGTLDTSGVRVSVTFSDGIDTDTRIVGLADGVTVSAPDTATAGDKTLTVSYLGSNATVVYHVRAIQSIAILSGSISDALRNGYAVDYSGLVLKITYSNGDEEQKAVSELTGVTYAGTEIGSTSFSVTYEGCTATQALTIIYVDRISALNNTVPAVVLQGGAGQMLSYDTFKLSVYYKNGDVYLIPFSDSHVTTDPANGAFSLAAPGMKAIKIYYNDGTTTAYTEVNIWVKGVTKVEIVGGVLNVVTVGKELDTSGISVKVTYDDGSYTYVNRTNPNLEVIQPNTSVAGTATLTVKYSGVPGTMTVTVKEAPSLDNGLIFGALLPDEIVARDSYKKNYKDSTSAYRVGDDNKYYFYLNVIQLDDNDNIIDVDGKAVPTAAKIFLVEGGSERELTGAELTSMVTFTSGDNSYDFTEAAIGKTFKLVIRPADDTSYIDEGAVTKEQTVTVVDGYNIYKAWELNVMTNCANNINKAFDGAPALYQKDVATEFLRKKGITRPEVLGGIVLHCNLNVTENDIPAEYVCSYEKNGVPYRGLYDQLGIFHRELTTSQKTFAIYGNYYSVYSYEISPVAHKGYGGNPDDFSSSDLFKIRTSTDVYGSLNLNIGPDQMVFDDYRVNIQDIATRDNDPNSNDQTASERHMRGIICYKLGGCVANVTNINVEAYQTTMLVEDANSTLNLNKVNFYNAWQGHLFLWNDNYVQRYLQGDAASKNTPTADYARDVVVNITDSSLTKCGGPVIIAQNDHTDYACNNGTGNQVNVDAISDLHTYVTGQEAWFVAVGQTQLAAQIRAMSRMVSMCNGQVIANGYGYISTDKIQGVETVNMIMVNMGTGITFDGSETYNGSFIKDGVAALKMSNGKNDKELYQNSALQTYINKTTAMNGSPAPIYQSSGGGTALTDGENGCFGLETGALGAPQTAFYSGNYITLYYMGIGIMMEYYHP